MKKLFFFAAFFAVFLCLGQSKYTASQVESSTDPQVIANFIKFNPTHPKTPEFRRKLLAVINHDKTPAAQARVAKPTVKPISTSKLKSDIKKDVSKDGRNDKHKRTAYLLNHLFNSDPASSSAYVQIINKSKCNLIVKISGKKFYNLDVPAHNQNFVLLEKGAYTLTTSVCDAKYTSRKNITKDIVVTLNAPK